MSLLKDIAESSDTSKKEVFADTNPPALNLKNAKFRMIKEFTNVQTALKSSDKTDAGKSDVSDRATAAQDVGFNLMRNTINSAGQVTGSDIADFIERAEELNDEIDTIPFGLETDDGQIVKVYVNAEQADAFEDAMKNMLGLEDDIEEAINRLTADFDIVDVVWPKTDDDQDDDGVPDDDADLEIDDTSNLDPDDDDDFADDQYDVIGDVNAPPLEADASGKPKISPVEDEPEEEEEPSEEEDSDGDGTPDEEDEDPDNPDKSGKKKKKGKKKAQPAEPSEEGGGKVKESLEKLISLNKEDTTTQEKDMTIGSKFLNRVLGETLNASQKRAVLKNFKEWSGGFEPESSRQINSYVTHAMDSNLDETEVREHLKTLLETNESLSEATSAEDRDSVKDGFNIPLDAQARAMTSKLKLPFAKRLIAFHFMCGVPGRYMNTAEITEAVAGAADMLRKKVAVRRAFQTLYDGLAAAKGFSIPQGDAVQEAKSDAKRLAGQDPEKIMKAKQAVKVAKKALADHNKHYDGGTGSRAKKLQADIDAAMGKLAKLNEEADQLDEAKQKRGGFIQKLLESVLTQLGLPEALITTTGPSAVGTGIYRTAELIEQDSTLERALRLLATRMGIRSSDTQKSVEEELELDEAVDVGNDVYAQAVTALVSALGIPDDILERRRTQVIQSLRKKKATIRNRSQVLTMIGRVMNILTKNTVNTPDQQNVPDQQNAPGETNEAASRWVHLSALQEARKPKLPKEKDVPIEVSGVKGMKSTPWSKKFKNQEAMEKWMETNGEDITVHAYNTDRAE